MTATRWLVFARPGYFGSRKARIHAALDESLGQGRWLLCYAWRGAVVSRDVALSLYEDAYTAHLAADHETLEWLVRTASDVYDTSPDNVRSGLDYHAQNDGPTHLQDIALRRAVARLGRRFEGDHLVEVRGKKSEGFRLHPGAVPFHAPADIVAPQLVGWWQPGSIEDFWQSNKLVAVRDDVGRAAAAELAARLGWREAGGTLEDSPSR